MGTTDSELARQTLTAMTKVGVQFALLHGLERFQSGELSDLDTVVSESPRRVVERTRDAWQEIGLHPILIWPYDIGGTATVFLATETGSQGVQLDLLFDPRGVGHLGIPSPALLDVTEWRDELPVVPTPASLVYQWAKRVYKQQWNRLPDLQQEAAMVDDLARWVNDLTGSDRVLRQITGQTRPTYHRSPGRSMARATRLLHRMREPIGYWVHFCDNMMAEQASASFGRLLPHSRSGQVPRFWPIQALWLLKDVTPVRLRPGLYVSWGRTPSVQSADLCLTTNDREEAHRLIVSSMANRLLP